MLTSLVDASKVLSLGEKTINNYYDIQRLLNADKMYEEMLLFIAKDTGSVPVKNAAQELYNALHGGWRELTNLLAGDIENEVANKVYDKLVEKVIAALPYGEIIKTSLHYSVDLSNLLFKTDDVQKQKDNMRCIAYIGSSISRWLINTRMEYLTGADSTKAENAEKNSICILYVIEDSYGRRRKPSEDDGNSQNFMEGCLWSIERNFRNIKI